MGNARSKKIQPPQVFETKDNVAEQTAYVPQQSSMPLAIQSTTTTTTTTTDAAIAQHAPPALATTTSAPPPMPVLLEEGTTTVNSKASYLLPSQGLFVVNNAQNAGEQAKVSAQ